MPLTCCISKQKTTVISFLFISVVTSTVQSRISEKEAEEEEERRVKEEEEKAKAALVPAEKKGYLYFCVLLLSHQFRGKFFIRLLYNKNNKIIH